MKNLFRSIYTMLKELGYARAAAAHARSGDYAKAKSLMVERASCGTK